MRFVTTFGASKVEDKRLYEEGVALGRLLASKGYGVKCGGYGGLMEAVSKGVSEVGGVCIGIGLRDFDAKRAPNPYLTKKIVASSLYERLELLIEGSDIFIAQQGSVGTLNEIFMVTALKYGGIRKEIRIILLGAFWEKRCAFLDENFYQNVELYKDIAALMERI